MPARWTIDELVERVADALAADPPGPTSGRVRDVPDRRAIRWYTTIGLLDRPYPSGGRVVHYGRRHLLQVVAIKRRQAQGRSLAEIQAELVGATDEQLAAIARLPLDAQDADAAHDVSVREPPNGREEPRRDRTHFWRERPAPPQASMDDAPATEVAGPVVQKIVARYPDGDHRAPGRRHHVMYGVPVAPGVTLLMDATRPPDDHDVDALRAAATPLLDVLRRRHLLPVPPATTADSASAQGRQP